jgi:sialate O-acetylesterase
VALASGLNNFEIAGADKIYVMAEAKVVNNKVVVSNQTVAAPLFVRYAWSDCSGATLFNKEGLPASTFTSEN